MEEQLREERRKNERLTAAQAKINADLAYIAMMADVDLDEGGEDGGTQQEV